MNNIKNYNKFFVSAMLSLVLLAQVLTGCGSGVTGVNNNETTQALQVTDNNSKEQEKEAQLNRQVENQSDIENAENNAASAGSNLSGDSYIIDERSSVRLASSADYTASYVPEFDGNVYVALDGNMPSFSEDEKKSTTAFENYSELDSLKRCGVAYANVCKEIMPTEKRGSIGSVKPTGWHTKNYHELVDGNYLYNRCHLIAFELAGENANVKNLITGTRYFNVKGMLPYENKVAQYVKSTNNHVLYRVTPVFVGENLVATGVRMEGWSVEDNGAGICFNIFVYNIQPGIAIDYATGDSWIDDSVQVTDTSLSSNSGNTSNQAGSGYTAAASQQNEAGDTSDSANGSDTDIIAAMAIAEAALHEAVPEQTYVENNVDSNEATDIVVTDKASVGASGDEDVSLGTQENNLDNGAGNTDSTDMVWIASSGSGKKYHSSPTCSNMKNPIQITKQQAEAQGKGACSKCY